MKNNAESFHPRLVAFRSPRCQPEAPASELARSASKGFLVEPSIAPPEGSECLTQSRKVAKVGEIRGISQVPGGARPACGL